MINSQENFYALFFNVASGRDVDDENVDYVDENGDDD